MIRMLSAAAALTSAACATPPPGGQTAAPTGLTSFNSGFSATRINSNEAFGALKSFWTLFQEWTLPMIVAGSDEEWFPAEPAIRDSCRILKLTDAVFEYEHAESGVRFQADRVDHGVAVPDQ
jgi:hypothetical protein